MRLPPLNALRAFEAAARHGGFVGASDELNVTRGAVSRHVKVLEDHLGVALFVRQAQGVRLTAAGRRLLPVLTDSFRRIEQETARLASDTGELRVLCPPATSIRWLIPRLEGFRAAHPDIRVRLTTDFFGDIGFDAGEYDVAFSVERFPMRAAHVEMQTLFPVLITPACSPGYLQDRPWLRAPADLARTDLLHETPGHPDWRAWVDGFGPGEIDVEAGQTFPNLDMATRAAVMGTGMVMADLVLCREELEAGALVAPFPDMTCESPYGGVCILGARDRWNEPKIAAFRRWAGETAARDAADLPPPARAWDAARSCLYDPLTTR